MAIDKGMYSLQQFKVAIINETTLGTANVTSMQYVNIDSPVSVNHGTLATSDVRSGGSGRTLKAADVYTSVKAQEKEVSFSGVWDQTVGAALLENVTGLAVGSSPAGYAVAYNYTPPETATGDTDSDYTGSMTVALISPEGSNSEIWPGCFVDSLRVYADAATDGGRLHFDVTLKTRHNVTFAQAAPTTPSVYPTTFRTIFDAVAKKSVFGVDAVLTGGNLQWLGMLSFSGIGTDGVPVTIARGIPDLMVSGVFGVKYDANTAVLINSASTGTACTVEISNNATWASSSFGIKGAYGEIIEDIPIVDVDGGAFLDIPVRFTAFTTGDVFEMVP